MKIMKHGLFIGSFGEGADPEFVLSTSIAAEKAGWDAILLPDHLFHENSDPFLDPWVMLSGIASRTSKIKLGTWVTPIARRQPWQLAKDLSTLDRLSNGRIIFGVGLGSPPSDFTKVGLDFTPKHVAEKMDEALFIITELWKGEPLNFKGKYYDIDKGYEHVIWR